MKTLSLHFKSINNFLNYSKNIIALLIFITYVAISLKAQTGPSCNLLFNSGMSYNNSLAIGHVEPLNYVYVPGWVGFQTPQINHLKYVSSPSSIMMWTSGAIEYEGIFQHLPNLEVGKPYIYSIKASKVTGFNNVTTLKTYATNSAYSLQAPTQILNGPHQPILYVNNISDTNFQHFYTCNFTPSQSWNYLVIHPDNPVWGSPPLQWVLVDDAELIENFGFAGPDTFICEPTTSIKIGTGACSGVSGFTFAWYENTVSGSPIGTNAELTISPTTTTEYILARTYYGCTSYDTTKLTVLNVPKPNLANDIVICDSPSVFNIIAYHNDTLLYKWQPFWAETVGMSSVSVWQTGTYVLSIEYEGCAQFDTINVTFTIPAKIIPDTVNLCNTDSVTFCATQGLFNYYWNTGDTSSCITVYDTGTYTVFVSDTNGCVAVAYSLLKRFEPISVDLGPDRVVCYDACVDLSPAIFNSATKSNFTYIWNTSDTSSSICANNTGDFWVCVFDSVGCMACDTVHVTLLNYLPPTVNNLGPICLHETSFVLNHGTPSGGDYYGIGIDQNKFHPTAVGPGIHMFTYTVISDSGCIDSASFQIEVIESPFIELHDVLLCETDGPYIMTVLHNTNSYTVEWSVNLPGGYVDVNVLGPGTHHVWAKVVDPVTGCDYTAYAKIHIGKVYTVNYTDYPIDADGWECMGAVIKHEAFNAYNYKWIDVNDPTNVLSLTSVAYLVSNGNYRLYVSDTIGNCPIDSADIDINLPNCCEQSAVYPTDNFEYVDGELYLKQSHVQLEKEKLCFDIDIVIEAEQILEINESWVIMNNCSKILVKNGGWLKTNNTEIGYCQWEGIEAGGWFDCCQEGMSGHSTCKPPNCQLQATVEIINSKINTADIGIFAGLRQDNNDCNWLDRIYSGGAIIKVNGSVFSNNYIDIMFREYDITMSNLSNCETDISNKRNQSSIESNYFLTPATGIHCTEFAPNLISAKGNPISRCHIVDLSEIKLEPTLSIGQTLRGYLGPYNPPFASTPNALILPQIKNNHYSNNSCSSLKFYK